MPSLGSHLARARQLADRLALPEVDADRGAFYLGATAPDIRVITRLDRAVTHFFDLKDFGEQDGVARMFEAHPALATPAGLDAATTAFIAGYLTHLVLDETFISEVYRPSFGASSPLKEEPRANVLDRALQYELDRRDREDEAAMAEVRAAIEATAPVSGIPFIADEHLAQWMTVSADVAGQAADYSRFRRMMMRHLEGAGYDAAAIEASCEDPHGLIREAFGVVSEERIERFWRDATDRMEARVRSYLR
ncbi:MAG: zinc dependent phospholipase C family protein [Chloroflexi bacterium]|nr:zinc dependent phospholipase C family protein [Chloroflexota bacterium]